MRADHKADVLAWLNAQPVRVANQAKGRAGCIWYRVQEYLVIIVGGSLIAATTLRHHDVQAIFFLHILIGETMLAAEISAANLEPYEIIRVIDDPHLVRLGVTHAQRGIGPGG